MDPAGRRWTTYIPVVERIEAHAATLKRASSKSKAKPNPKADAPKENPFVRFKAKAGPSATPERRKRPTQQAVRAKLFPKGMAFALLPGGYTKTVSDKAYILSMVYGRGLTLKLRNTSNDATPKTADRVTACVHLTMEARYGLTCNMVAGTACVHPDTDGTGPETATRTTLAFLGLDPSNTRLFDLLHGLMAAFGPVINALLHHLPNGRAARKFCAANPDLGVGDMATASGYRDAWSELWGAWKDMSNVDAHINAVLDGFGLSAESNRGVPAFVGVMQANAPLASQVVDMLAVDPFVLHDMLPRSFPLPAVQSIAARAGFPSHHPFAVLRKLTAALCAAEGEGHAYLPLGDLVKDLKPKAAAAAAAILDGSWAPPPEYPPPLRLSIPKRTSRSELGEEAEAEGGQDGMVFRTIGNPHRAFHVDDSDEAVDPRVYRLDMWETQAGWLATMKTHVESRLTPKDDTDDAIADALADFGLATGISLTDEQRAVVDAVAKTRVTAVVGDAGSGKTTTLRAALHSLKRVVPGLETLALAPTGKAARVITAKTGVKALTVDSLLWRVRNGGLAAMAALLETEPKDLTAAPVALVIDEMSMVTLRHIGVWDIVCRTLARPVLDRVVLIGDGSQLAPIGAGAVFADSLQMLEKCGGVARLTGCQRVADDSVVIYTNARRLRGGAPRVAVPDFELRPGTWDLVPVSTAGVGYDGVKGAVLDAVMAIVGPVVRASVSADKALVGLQVLSLTNDIRGVINAAVQAEVQAVPASDASLKLGRDETAFIGDKVMVCENAYELGVVNGDIGWVVDLPRGFAVLELEDGRVVKLPHGATRLTLAYCVTVHKSQGSEFDHVVLAVPYTPTPMSTRRLAYTAFSRAARRMTTIVPVRALEGMINRPDPPRNSDAVKLWNKGR